MLLVDVLPEIELAECFTTVVAETEAGCLPWPLR